MSLYENYDISIIEEHNKDKPDKPSGTAIRLAEDICMNNDNMNDWILNDKGKKSIIPVRAVREKNVTGIHTVKYESDVDYLEIMHIAKNRKGFAAGAVIAAEFLKNKKGFYGMKDLLGFGG